MGILAFPSIVLPQMLPCVIAAPTMLTTPATSHNAPTRKIVPSTAICALRPLPARVPPRLLCTRLYNSLPCASGCSATQRQ